MPLCHKCGPVSWPEMNKSSTICDDCWETYDMGRFEELRPDRGEAPTAKAIQLISGKIGVICPHCDYKVHRTRSYYHQNAQRERCPKCMEHYIVRREKTV